LIKKRRKINTTYAPFIFGKIKIHNTHIIINALSPYALTIYITPNRYVNRSNQTGFMGAAAEGSRPSVTQTPVDIALFWNNRARNRRGHNTRLKVNSRVRCRPNALAYPEGNSETLEWGFHPRLPPRPILQPRFWILCSRRVKF